MEYNLVISIGTLALSIMFLFLYCTKRTIKSVRTSLYISLIVFVILFCITDMISIAFYANNMSNVLCKTIWLLHWIICNSIFYIFVLYSVYIGNNIEIKRYIDLVKYNIVTIIASISMIIVMILMFTVFPLKPMDLNNLDFTYFPSIIYCGFLVLCMILVIFKDRKTLNSAEKHEIVLLVGAFIFFVTLQVLLKNYSIIPAGFLIVCFVFYFNTENPDLLLIADISKIKDKMESNNKTKDNFMINISEKINLPCSLIYDLSKELELSDDNKINDEMIDNSNKLLDSISNLFNTSDLDISNGESVNKVYSTSTLISRLIDNTKKKLASKNVSLVLNISDSISSSLLGNEIKLYQSVYNLILNAIDNTNVGKITISVSSTKDSEYDELLFRISDTGNGIKDEDKYKIFNSSNGNGFGLSISKEYIESMGGTIWFDSNYQSGSNFYIKIKQKIVDSTPIGDINNNDNSINYTNYFGKKILVVESDELNSLLMDKLLDKYNIETVNVKSAKECIYNIKSNCMYDMIFVEHELSDISGIELLHSLMGLDGYKIPPVIMVSANAILGMKDIYIKEGFNDYLAKPINMKELDIILNKYLKEQ